MNNCKQFEKQIFFYAMGELSDKEKEIIEKHLAECADCAAFYEKQKVFISKLEKRPSLTPTNDLLEECRSELRTRLQHERRARLAPSLWEKIMEFFTAPAQPARVLLTTAALLLFGLFIGRYVIPSPSAALNRSLSNADYMNILMAVNDNRVPDIHSIQYDPVTQKIDVRVATSNTFSIRGDMNDEFIRRVLSEVLFAEDNAGLRLRTVKAIASNPISDEDVESALIHALENDPNSGVRLQAVKVLKNLPINQDIKNALLHVLVKDANPRMRKEAVDALSTVKDEDILSTLYNVAQQDSNSYVRLKASKVIERRDDQ